MHIGLPTWLLVAASVTGAAATNIEPSALFQVDTVDRGKAQCHRCCNATTVYSTIFLERTHYVTATQHDISTKLEYTTEFITTTATNTFPVSYPVTVTRTIDCDGHVHKRNGETQTEDMEPADQDLRRRTYGCRTTTVTEWVTTTATKLITGIESVIATRTVHITVPVPTTVVETVRDTIRDTVHDTHTIVHPTTIWVPTTFLSTTTIVSERPVTLTKDNTIFTTRFTTVFTTLISTVITSVPVVSYLTKSVTQTIVDSTTIWVPTTYLRTRTLVSESPVTLTKDNTVVITQSTTVYTTLVTTVVTSVPIVSYVTNSITQTITAPGQQTTVTRKGDEVTLTKTGENIVITSPVTVTVPGPTSTLTLPGGIRTLPGSTIVSIVTQTQPPSTVIVTEPQTTRTITQPGSTFVETKVQTLAPSTVSVPASTVTVTPLFSVSLCPSPTGASRPLERSSNLTFGCAPGFVCNPPKPDGCNLWPSPPKDDFVCNPLDCIPAPPYTVVTWKECETSYYPPSFGYFNLNPEDFGLSYGIFEYKQYQKVESGVTKTFITGDWNPKASATEGRQNCQTRHIPAFLLREL
ncbi:glycoprotein X [Moelleriella libera RCEF 2490]|uniref:Glycoprotein X n=1 Tax=Moelleriella libera RCEF 2490 TaxID=1081109 RepID=A0A166U895_9HYPO|nr:glycoprotein X [Moelleriella libera RCEF 2490]